MPQSTRNSHIKDGWLLTKVADHEQIKSFDCGDCDLNEYFRKDVLHHKDELLTETYCLSEATLEIPFPVALIDLCNDSINRKKFKLTPWDHYFVDDKRYPAYPSVKITRLGVHSEFQGEHLGSHIINMVREMFLTDNRTGCRFVTVDAYNKDAVVDFYLNNHFQFFSESDKNKKTRAMYFDLKRLDLE